MLYVWLYVCMCQCDLWLEVFLEITYMYMYIYIYIYIRSVFVCVCVCVCVFVCVYVHICLYHSSLNLQRHRWCCILVVPYGTTSIHPYVVSTACCKNAILLCICLSHINSKEDKLNNNY